MATVVFIFTSVLMFIDLKTKNLNATRTGIVWFLYLLALSVVGTVYVHYFLPVIVFYLLWVLEKRSNRFDWLSKLLLLVIIISSLFALPRILTEGNWESNTKNTKKITLIIENEIAEQALINANIVVLASEDPNIYGRKFRDLMQLHKKVELKSKDEYYISDNLFVITTADEERVRSDPAVEMDGFRRGIIKTTWAISDSDWKVYRFDRY
jgi:amino acid transporter